MITKQGLIASLKIFANTQLDKIAKDTPMLALAKPLIQRGLNNNINKVSSYLDFIANETGEIDIENIVPEMINSVMTIEPFPINAGAFGDIIVGGGYIRVTIPYINREVVFDHKDLEALKDVLITKN